MKKVQKFKVVDRIIVTLPNSEAERFEVGGMYGDEKIGAFITNGERVQILNTRIEEMDPSINPADYLIATFYGFPYVENYRWAEIEIDIPDEETKEVPAEKAAD